MTPTTEPAWRDTGRVSAAHLARFQHHMEFANTLGVHRPRYDQLSPKARRAFCAYLLCVQDADLATLDLVDRFEAKRNGSFTTWQDARNALAHELGWPQTVDDGEIDTFPRQVIELLKWSEYGIRTRLEMLNHIIELDDGHVFVFYR